MRIDLHIGGSVIRIEEPGEHPCFGWPLPAFVPFLETTEGAADLQVTVNLVPTLPELPHGKPLFDACHGLWRLYQAESDYLLEADDPQSHQLHIVAFVSADFSRVQLWTRPCLDPEGRRGWEPVRVVNPIVEVCFITRLARQGGILLHAAGVLREDRAWLFTGPSGSGKSTLSEFFAARGASVLSDERIIIQKINDEFMAFGTPWAGFSGLAENQSTRVDGVYCIHHGKDGHALRPLHARETSVRVLRQCFLPHWDPEGMSKTLAFLTELIEQVECRELAFLKNPDIVDYLEEQRSGRSVALS
jgi:hypothetical protein